MPYPKNRNKASAIAGLRESKDILPGKQGMHIKGPTSTSVQQTAMIARLEEVQATFCTISRHFSISSLMDRIKVNDLAVENFDPKVLASLCIS